MRAVDLSASLRSLKHLFTKIRDRDTSPFDFRIASKRIMHMICEESIGHMDAHSVDVITPTASVYQGEVVDVSNIVGVSIIRSGDSMLDVFLNIVPTASVGKILIQRDEASGKPVFYYTKLPSNLATKTIVLLDPMLATGGSAICALSQLKEHGADLSKAFFLSVVGCPEGISAIQASFPEVRIICGCIDEKLNENRFIVPGLGDFGDRFFGTEDH